MIKDLNAIYDEGVDNPIETPDPKPKSQPKSATPIADLNNIGGRSFANISPTNVNEYIDYMPEGVYDEKNEHQSLDTIRGYRQSFGEKLGRRAANLVPNILSNLVGMVGSIGSLGAEWGDQRDYSNALTDIANDMRDPFGKTYRHDNSTWAIGDASWWLDNAFGTAETAAAFALGGAGIGGALGTGAKLLGGSRLLMGAAQLGTAGLVSYAEAAQAGAQVYQEVYNNQLRKQLASGKSSEEAHETARHIAAQSAATTAQIGTAGTMFLNVGAYAPLFRKAENVAADVLARRIASMEGASSGQVARALRSTAAEDFGNLLLHHEGVRGIAREMLGEGAEEFVQQFAQDTGTALGNKGQTKGLLSQFGEFEHIIDRTANSEGLLAFTLGAAFGGLQHGLLHNVIPSKQVSTGTQVFNDDGSPKLDKQGNPVMEMKWVTPRAYEHDFTKRSFNTMKEALASEFENQERLENELVKAVAEGKPLEAARIRQELFLPTQINAIRNGITEPWVKTFEKIAATDNQEKGEDGKTAAQRAGYADEAGTDTHAKEAKKAIQSMKELTDVYNTLKTRYGLQYESQQHLEPYIDMVFGRYADLHMQKGVMTQYQEELAGIRKQEQSLAQLDPEFSEQFRQAHADAQSGDTVLKQLVEDHDALFAAAQSGDIQRVSRLLRKYRAVGMGDGNTQEAVQTLLDRLSKKAEQVKAKAEASKEALFNGQHYQAWLADNQDGTFSQYLEETAQRQALSKQGDAMQAELAMAQAQYDIAQSHLTEMTKEKNLFRFTKKVDEWQKNAAKEKEQVEQQKRAQLAELAKDKAATNRLQRLEMNGLADKYAEQAAAVIAQIQEIDARIANVEKEIAESRGEFLRVRTLRRVVRRLQAEKTKLQARLRYLQSLESTHRVDTAPAVGEMETEDLTGEESGKITMDAADAPSTGTGASPTIEVVDNLSGTLLPVTNSPVEFTGPTNKEKPFVWTKQEGRGKTINGRDWVEPVTEWWNGAKDNLRAVIGGLGIDPDSMGNWLNATADEEGMVASNVFGKNGELSLFLHDTGEWTIKTAAGETHYNAEGELISQVNNFTKDDLLNYELPEEAAAAEAAEEVVFDSFWDAEEKSPAPVRVEVRALMDQWRAGTATLSLDALKHQVAAGVISQAHAARLLQLAYNVVDIELKTKAAQIDTTEKAPRLFSTVGKNRVLLLDGKFSYETASGKPVSVRQEAKLAARITPNYFPAWYRELATDDQKTLLQELVQDVRGLQEGSDVTDNLQLFLMRNMQGVKFSPRILKDLTDVSAKAWTSEKGISLDRFVLDHLGVGNEEFAEQSEAYQAGFGHYDEQEMMNEVREMIRQYPRGITAKALREEEARNNPQTELDQLSAQFLDATGLDLMAAISKLQDLAVTPEALVTAEPVEEVIPEPVEILPVVQTAGPSTPATPVVTYADAHAIPAAYHAGNKIVEFASTGAASTINYEQGTRTNVKTGETMYVMVPIANELNLTEGNKKILDPKQLLPNHPVRYEVDVEYDGPKHDSIGTDGKLVITRERGTDYLITSKGSQSQVNMHPQALGNVPIKVVDEKTGETLFHLRTLRALEMAAPGTDLESKEGYRNVVALIEGEEGTIDNLSEQRAKLMEHRQAIVEQFNRTGAGVSGTIKSKGTGSLILNRKIERTNGNLTGTIEPKLAWNRLQPKQSMLPEDVELAIVPENGAVPHSGLAYPTTKDLGFDRSTLQKGGVGALVQAPNGQYLWAPLRGMKLLEDGQEVSRELRSTVRAIELFLLNDGSDPAITKEIESLEANTGFNLATASGLRAFLNQYFTYTQYFREADLSPNAAGSDGSERFVFDIDDRTTTLDKTRQIKIGFTMRGAGATYANLENGKLSEAFVQLLAEGYRTRSRAAVWTNPGMGIKGVNATGTFLDAYYEMGTGKWKHIEYPSYNHFLKSYSKTEVFGQNQLPDGTYVYAANPHLNLELPDMRSLGTLVVANESAKTLPPVPEDKGYSEEATKTFDDIFGLGRPSAKREVASIGTAPEGSRALTIQALEELHTFTPEAERNGKTPKEALEELTARGHSFLPDGFNPFTRCL